MKRRDAFTLTELLALVPIVALLGVLLVPSLNDTKQTLQAAACLNNMRQWGLAIGMYCNDFNDYMPYEGAGLSDISQSFQLVAWFNILSPYVKQPRLMDLYAQNEVPLPGMKSIFICPSAPDITYMPTTANPYFSYAMNRVLTGLSGQVYKRTKAVLPAKTILFSESENNQFPFTDGFFIGPTTTAPPPAGTPRHSGGNNFVFVDGHAQWYKQADYSRTKVESFDAEIEWAKPRVLYWFPCGDPDTCNKQ